MHKIKQFILFAALGFFIIQNSVIFGMNKKEIIITEQKEEQVNSNLKKTLKKNYPKEEEKEQTNKAETILNKKNHQETSANLQSTSTPSNTPSNNSNGKTWSSTIIKILIQSTIIALVGLIINPELIKLIVSTVNSKYALELKMQKFISINKSLKTQLKHLKIHCRDAKIIKAIEETYKKSCLQIMILQKNYLERYAK